MTTQHNPDEVARLIERARSESVICPACEGHRLIGNPAGWVDWCSACLGTERQHVPLLRAMADQLEAAQGRIADLEDGVAEGVRHVSAGAFAISTLTAERDKLRADLADMIRNFETAESEAEQLRTLVQALRFDTDQRDKLQAELESARKDAEHWREARRAALEGGEILKAGLEAARREVERLTALSDLRGQTVADLAHVIGTVKGGLDLMRPVVEFAERLTDAKRSSKFAQRRPVDKRVDDVCAAVDAYRAARDKAGG